jgi:hypothetical protein
MCKRIMGVTEASIQLRYDDLVFKTTARCDMLVGCDIAETAT